LVKIKFLFPIHNILQRFLLKKRKILLEVLKK
jgi:hypothetical protein